MPSLFDAMYTVNFDEKDHIVEMNSNNGETIKMDKDVICVGGVEVNKYKPTTYKAVYFTPYYDLQ